MKRMRWILPLFVLLFLFAMPVRAEGEEGWVQEENGFAYYLEGEKQIGWLTLEGGTYYFDANGTAVKERWVARDGDWYYLGEDYCVTVNAMVPDSVANCYVDGEGRAVKDCWVFYDDAWYYFKSDCRMLTSGWERDSRGWCYLQEDGRAASGKWICWKGDWYYLKADYRMAENEWAMDSAGHCYLRPDGRAARNAWVFFEDDWYFLKANYHRAESEWERDSKGWCYLQEDGRALREKWLLWKGDWYYLKGDYHMAASEWARDSSGPCYLDASGRYRPTPKGYNSNSVKPGGKTLKNFLQNAMIPCGSTLYVFGGGWGTSDSQKIGYLPTWGAFFVEYGSASYNSNNWRFQYGKGLDCSGYVAWAAYNTIYTENGKDDILANSNGATGLATRFTQRGWTKSLSIPKKYEELRPGDVCSMNGHVYICLGTCSDGSAVILHSSTTGTKGGGVQISATQDRNQNWNSEARTLARRYMKEYFPHWPWEGSSVGQNYLTSLVGVARWKNDPDGLQNKSAEEILEIIFQA